MQEDASISFSIAEHLTISSKYYHISALLPNANKIRLQELANTELLVSLNEPFGKNELEQDVSEDEKDEEDYIVSERQSEQQKLIECKWELFPSFGISK